jgi:hypothetical protein
LKEKFSLRQANLSAEWDAFVRQSPEGTLFSESVYLQAIERKAECWFVHKGDQAKAGLILLRTRDGAGFELDDDVIYSGLFFAAPDPRWEQNRCQTLSNRFQLTEFVVEEVTKKATRIGLALAPGVNDIRPFLWHAYHDPDAKKRFHHDIRYTSYLNVASILEGEEEATPEFLGLGTSRRQEIRYARKDGARGRVNENIDQFVDLLQHAAKTQGRDVSERSHKLKKIMRDLTKNARGFIFAITDTSGQMMSAAFFAHDSKRAYYLYGANHPELQNRFSGTIVLWDAFKHLRQLGIQEIDLEGVNSPKRGWFKMSFGGELREYHQLTLDSGG